MKTRKLAPIHPGEILREEFIKPRGVSQNALARCFGTTAEIWTGLQADDDLRLAPYEKERQIERDVEPLAALQPAMA